MNIKWKSVGWGAIIALFAGIGGVGVYLGTHESVSGLFRVFASIQKQGEIRRKYKCEFSIVRISKGVIEPLVDQVINDTPAERAGFKAGDRILTIDETPVSSFSDVIWLIGSNPGRELTIKVERSGTQLSLHVAPELSKYKDSSGQEVCHGAIGIRPKVG